MRREPLRDAVETAAARLSCVRASNRSIRELGDRLGTSELARQREDAVRSGAGFHVELAALSGNRFFANSVVAAMTLLARTRWLEVRTEAARRTAWEEHRRILDLIVARDADEAAALIHVHIVGTHERLLAALDADAHSLRARGLTVVR
ncbi:FadR/GntR family transcriptional regulator [Leifsonia xyli]|uniref:FadR/GntR family transcriptional regulator n=1 Tax=Leifsonia xyli TaxID=1575 RepID=UPI000309463A|nr:FCD domain-containing protein [Leifsonia xyli]